MDVHRKHNFIVFVNRARSEKPRQVAEPTFLTPTLMKKKGPPATPAEPASLQ